MSSMYKSIFIAIISILSNSIFAQDLNQKNVNAEKTIYYFFQVTNSNNLFSASLQRGIEKYPQMQLITESVKNNFSLYDLSKKFSRDYSNMMSEADLNSCILFIDSNLGNDLLIHSKSDTFQKDSNSYFNSLSKEDTAKVMNYLNSKCIIFNTNFMPQAQVILSEYMNLLICNAAKTEQPQLYKTLLSQQFCK